MICKDAVWIFCRTQSLATKHDIIERKWQQNKCLLKSQILLLATLLLLVLLLLLPVSFPVVSRASTECENVQAFPVHSWKQVLVKNNNADWCQFLNGNTRPVAAASRCPSAACWGLWGARVSDTHSSCRGVHAFGRFHQERQVDDCGSSLGPWHS